MFVNTKNPYMFQSFLFDHPQGATCKSVENIIVTAQSTACGPLRMVE